MFKLFLPLVSNGVENKMTNSLSRYIRKEKARIRREVLNPSEQQGLIDVLYKKYFPKQNDNPGNIQPGDK